VPVERQQQERDRDGRRDRDRRGQLDQGRDRGLRSALPAAENKRPARSNANTCASASPIVVAQIVASTMPSLSA
jgi:hypothetical protein